MKTKTKNKNKAAGMFNEKQRKLVHCKNSGVKLTPDWIQYRSNLEWCQFNTIAVLF